MATMIGNATDVVQQILKGEKPYRFRGLKLPNVDFTDLDLSYADFRNASVPYGKFVRTKLRFANFESANLYGCDFTDADCHRINFKDAILSDTIMEAKDLFGATITLECRSFQGMQLSPGWWWGWVFYPLLMKPPSKDAEEKLITAMGVERYSVLREQYARRRM
jgi:hypothetical protein